LARSAVYVAKKKKKKTHPCPRPHNPDFLWWGIANSLTQPPSWRTTSCGLSTRLIQYIPPLGHFLYLEFQEYSDAVTWDPLSAASSKMELIRRTEK
jgi:hypothetical protein